MMISFHSRAFDTSKPIEEGHYYGEDLARWFEAKLTGWKTSVIEEDWGWAINAKKEQYKYLFGVYDHDTVEENENGQRWVLRLFNERDRASWFKSFLKYTPPNAHQEVIDEVLGILRDSSDVSDVSTEPL